MVSSCPPPIYRRSEMTRVVLYARVSTRRQAEKGYSLRQQIERLREYATEHGFEVLDEVVDDGYSGATLERPGLDRVRDLVGEGVVDAVLVQDLDRLTREPGHYWLLEEEFEVRGCGLRALNDDGDKSPEGELMRGMKGQLAKYERAKLTERARRGKLRKVREGKVLPSRRPPFGFRYADGEFVVDEGRMNHVRRAFRMIGAEGKSIRSVKRALDADGVPTPGGARSWQDSTIARWFTSDTYKPHTHDEVAALVAPEVAAKLDKHLSYGLYWFNRQRTRKINGHHTRKDNDPGEWVAVPVPDSGIPRELVEKARAAVKDNVRPPDSGRRYWDLKSLLFCPCGRRMTTFSARRNHGGKIYWSYYYICSERRRRGAGACEHGGKHHNAGKVEGRIRDFVLGLLRDPETMMKHVRKDVERERNRMRDAERERTGWYKELSEVERRRDALIEMRADGDITKEKFREKIAGLDARKAAAEQELGKLESGAEHARRLDSLPGLVEQYLADLPYLIDRMPTVREYEIVGHDYEPGVPPRTLTPGSIRFLPEEELAEKKRAAERARAERFRCVYETLGLKATVHKDGTIEVSGTFGAGSTRLTADEGTGKPEGPPPPDSPYWDGWDDREDRCRDERGPRRTRSRRSSRRWP